MDTIRPREPGCVDRHGLGSVEPKEGSIDSADKCVLTAGVPSRCVQIVRCNRDEFSNGGAIVS